MHSGSNTCWIRSVAKGKGNCSATGLAAFVPNWRDMLDVDLNSGDGVACCFLLTGEDQVLDLQWCPKGCMHILTALCTDPLVCCYSDSKSTPSLLKLSPVATTINLKKLSEAKALADWIAAKEKAHHSDGALCNKSSGNKNPNYSSMRVYQFLEEATWCDSVRTQRGQTQRHWRFIPCQWSNASFVNCSDKLCQLTWSTMHDQVLLLFLLIQ